MDAFASAAHWLQMLHAQEISSVELLELCLQQVRRHNPAVNAVVTLDEERAFVLARQADEDRMRGRARGALHGLPMTLKDSYSTQGMRTTAGYPPLADYIPDADACVSARLKAAGAIIFGKTNVPPLVLDIQTDNPIFGRTANPWDLTRTSGGSSGGACAALACGMTPLEVGSDLAGSIRIPAHFCGVFGLKTTEGRIPLTGHIPDLPQRARSLRIMAAAGPLARDLDDLALTYRLLSGPDGKDMEAPPVPLAPVEEIPWKSLRIAWSAGFPGVRVEGEVRQAVERLAGTLAKKGCRVEERLPALDFSAQRKLFTRLFLQISAPYGGAPENFVPPTLLDYFQALHERDEHIHVWEQFFEEWDALLCPVSMTAAFPHCESGSPISVDGEQVRYWESISHTCPFNLSGHPALAFPLTRSRSGLPIGAQLVARRWGEEHLLAAARRVLEAVPWSGFAENERIPPLCHG